MSHSGEAMPEKYATTQAVKNRTPEVTRMSSLIKPWFNISRAVRSKLICLFSPSAFQRNDISSLNQSRHSGHHSLFLSASHPTYNR